MWDFQDRDRHWEVETGQRPNPLKQDNDDDDFTKRDDITDVQSMDIIAMWLIGIFFLSAGLRTVCKL